MKSLYVAALLLLVSTIAMGAPENYPLGSFMVSFDMNSDVDHTVQVNDTIEAPFATIYPLLIVTDNTNGASITITEYKELQDSTLGLNAELSRLRLAAYRGINASVQKMNIDETNGFVLSGMPFPNNSDLPQITHYLASYWKDNQECSECGPVSVATTNVEIFSTYSEEMTMNLINSIRITKDQAPSQSSEQLYPPN